MAEFSLDALHKFIVRAKAATYVGSGSPSPSSRPASHDLEFQETPFTYLDSYFGGTDFIGEEVVYYHDQPIWAMNYYGRILDPARITGEEAGKAIKESLSRMYKEGRFLGGFETVTSYGVYHDNNQGDFTAFIGREWITQEERTVYELYYHGGLIQA
jgi:hypothetical protein